VKAIAFTAKPDYRPLRSPPLLRLAARQSSIAPHLLSPWDRQASYLYRRLPPPYKQSLGWGIPPTPPFTGKIARKVITTSKNKLLNFRLSESDMAKIKTKSARVDLTVSAFILSAALNKPIVVIDGLPDAVKEMRRIGANVNQLTTLANMEKIKCIELCDVKEELVKVWQSLNSLTQITG
jgi:hypothetical protein